MVPRYPLGWALVLLWPRSAVCQQGDNETTTDSVAPRCQDCWCVPANGQECPSFSPGLREGYPPEWLAALNTFERINDDSENDGIVDIDTCFPFPSLLENPNSDIDVESYPESARPSCQPPAMTNETVCAFIFPNAGTDDETCYGRSYRVQTFASAQEAALTANAMIVHQGPCGVCSNAHDLAARAETIDQMNPISVLCATAYVVDFKDPRRFAELTQCYQQNAGLSLPCATLWAHFGAANGVLCPGVCIPNGQNEIPLNNQDDCSLSPCLACSAQTFEDEFNQIAGLYKSPYNVGLLDPVAYPCANFYRVPDFDPCVGAIPGTLAPTTSPASAATVLNMSTTSWLWTTLLLGVAACWL